MRRALPAVPPLARAPVPPAAPIGRPALVAAPHPATLSGRLRRLARLVRRIIGAPDYEGYVAHSRRCHPDRPLLTEDQFVRQRLADRYSTPGSRCC